MPTPSKFPPEALLAASKRFNRASFTKIKSITRGDLNHSEWHLLWTLLHWPDDVGARPSELAQKQKVTAGNVAQQLRHLEQQTLIVRTHSDDDRRVVLVKLTTQGKKKLKQVRTEFVSQFENLCSHLGKKETENFIRLLTDSADFLGDAEVSSC